MTDEPIRSLRYGTLLRARLVPGHIAMQFAKRASLYLWVMVLLTGTITPASAQRSPVDERVQAAEEQIRLRPREAEPYLVLASIHREAGRLQAAERALHRGIAEAEDPRELRWALVQLLSEAERWEETAAALEPLAPDSKAIAMMARVRVNIGLAHLRAGQKEMAERAFERALVDDPALPEAALMLGQLLVGRGELEAARRVIDAGLEHAPGDSRLLAVRSATLEGAEGLASAITALRAARRERPTEDAIGLELARLLARSGDLPGVVALYDTLLTSPRPAEETYHSIGGFWLRAGQPDTSAAILARGLDRYPGSARLWEGLGDAEWERESWRDAALAYRKATARHSEPERAEMRVSDAYSMAGDTLAAISALEEMQRRPAPRHALLEVAQRAASLRDTALAKSVYSGLLDADPKDTGALEGAASLAEAAGDTAEALRLYHRAAEDLNSGPDGPLGILRLERLDPDSAESLLRVALWRSVAAVEKSEGLAIGAARGESVSQGASPLSRLLPDDPVAMARERMTGIIDRVVFETEWGPAELEQLRRAYPQSLHFRRYAADLAARQGRAEEALAAYDQLLSISASDLHLQKARAGTLENLGRTDEARSAYTRALELEPGDEEVFQALVRLHRAADTMPRLLEQVRRLQKMHPKLELLVQYEIELLHRSGRLEEAREVAKKHQERDP